ncbi:MAG TPA: alpha/beta fold hydrolase [Actinocrinis sp.]|nr:alpha/beta fold hydrolase [Actinocrinis sp.]
MTVGSGFDDDAWIRRYHQPPAGSPRLVCFPHAGGSASYYFPWSRTLAAEVEVLALQYPGRQDRMLDESAATIGELADGAYAALRARGVLDPVDGSPVSLFGHSMGAIVAFEITRRMQRDGLPAPARVFLSGRRAPDIYRATTPIHTLDDAGLVAEMKRVGGTHQDVLDNPDLQQLFLPTIRADYRAIETYRYEPGPPMQGPVTALTGDGDTAVTPDEAAAWERFTTGPFDLRVFRGGHFYLEEHSADLIDLVRTELTKGRS